MTQEEKKIKSYVNAIERRLRLPLKMKQRVNMDLDTDIHARMESGKSADEVIEELGTPEEVAGRSHVHFHRRKNGIPMAENVFHGDSCSGASVSVPDGLLRQQGGANSI